MSYQFINMIDLRIFIIQKSHVELEVYLNLLILACDYLKFGIKRQKFRVWSLKKNVLKFSFEMFLLLTNCLKSRMFFKKILAVGSIRRSQIRLSWSRHNNAFIIHLWTLFNEKVNYLFPQARKKNIAAFQRKSAAWLFS